MFCSDEVCKALSRKDEKLMESIEEWEANIKVLEQHGAAYSLSDQAKLNALEVLMGQK